jgi:hypothetical protein
MLVFDVRSGLGWALRIPVRSRTAPQRKKDPRRVRTGVRLSYLSPLHKHPRPRFLAQCLQSRQGSASTLHLHCFRPLLTVAPNPLGRFLPLGQPIT